MRLLGDPAWMIELEGMDGMFHYRDAVITQIPTYELALTLLSEFGDVIPDRERTYAYYTTFGCECYSISRQRFAFSDKKKWKP